MGVGSSWWRDSARRMEQAGFSTVWCWDHFMGRGRLTTTVLECWTTLAGAAAATDRIRVGSFVTNVMNRHPAVLAKIVATLVDQAGARVEVGVGVGGYAPEMAAYGIPFPPPAERVQVLEETVAVLRAMWSGGPVNFEGQHFQLHDAWAYPTIDPPPRIIVGGEKPAGARLAARVGDAWTTKAADYERLLPIHLDELARHGRSRSDVRHLVAISLSRDEPLERQPLITDMAASLAEWHERGADEIVVDWVRPAELAALLDAAANLSVRG
jgi:alkanesulfonate monooxygenase SsuD/methylene tetrahydromethanopterin reductase-like flavin-dependent oxidoreductase (luciferase family)